MTKRYWNVDTAFNVNAKNGFLDKYYYYLAMNFDYRFYLSHTTLPSMTQTAYENMLLPFPSLGEQQAIVVYLDAKTAEIDSLIEAKRQMADKLREYRKSLISEAVTGKFKVPGV
jgi:type I restriction enzyme S subunit